MDSATSIQLSQSTQSIKSNKLPPEMLRAILQRVPTHHLIRLRSLSSEWKALIEDICRDKKSLVVVDRFYDDYLSKLSNQFNGYCKLSHNFVFIQLESNQIQRKTHMSANLFQILAILFPQIEQFFTNVEFSYSSPEFISMFQQWSPSLTTLSLPNCDNLHDQINNISSLQRLNLDKFYPEIANQLAPTLNRLEHFSGCFSDSITSIVPLLGARLTSLGLRSLSIEKITKWRNMNAQFVSSLERLNLVTMDPQELQSVCNHFSSLRMLRIKSNNNVGLLKVNTDIIEHLARLTHLTELRFDSVVIDLASFDLANLQPLPNIRILSMVNLTFEPGNSDAHRFCCVLSTTFPNVNKLIIKSELYRMLEDSLESHVNHFRYLRSFDFSLDDPIDRLMD